jgi:16S rRNA (cytosine967-C5)-methyltransferase
VLRKLADAGEPPPPAALLPRLVEWHSFPEWIARRLPAEEAEPAAEAMNRPAPVTIRVAPGRQPDEQATPAGFPPEAYFLRGAGSPEQLEGFQRGDFTVQDLAAQLVGRLAAEGLRPGERVLDACAGVGGKSTHLAEQGADVVAADLSQRKLDLASDAARRLGLSARIHPLRADLTQPPPDMYDRILLDAPCTGLGVLRRHPEAKWRLREAEVAEMAALQERLLAALAPRVCPGGVLVYSVCSFTDEEGPSRLEAFLRTHPDFTVEAPRDPGFAPFLHAHTLRTWPHRHDADAFFAVRLRRSAA